MLSTDLSLPKHVYLGAQIYGQRWQEKHEIGVSLAQNKVTHCWVLPYPRSPLHHQILPFFLFYPPSFRAKVKREFLLHSLSGSKIKYYFLQGSPTFLGKSYGNLEITWGGGGGKRIFRLWVHGVDEWRWCRTHSSSQVIPGDSWLTGRQAVTDEMVWVRNRFGDLCCFYFWV